MDFTTSGTQQALNIRWNRAMTRRRSNTQRGTQPSAHPTESNSGAGDSMRIDKWLWSARFYKTRSLASEAVKTGKIAVNDERVKPSKEITPGAKISIKQPPNLKEVIVRGISHRRGPASEAVKLYEETLDSLQNRQHAEQLRQAQPAFRRAGQGRPTKRERRQIISFTTKPQ